MKRYILLIGDDYYPSRWDDFRGSYDSIDDALRGVRQFKGDSGSGFESEFDPSTQWYQIIDGTTGKVVKGSDEDIF